MMFRITNNSHQKIKINDKISILGNSTIIENITIDNRLQDLVNKGVLLISSHADSSSLDFKEIEKRKKLKEKHRQQILKLRKEAKNKKAK